MHILGFDPGNSESTLTWRSGAAARHVTVPSFVSTGHLEGVRNVRSAVGSEELARDEIVLTYDGMPAFVGRLALEEGRDADAGRNDTARYWSGHTLRLLLALAAQASINGAARVMTGLPISVWSPEHKRLVQRSLCGTHRYTVNGKERTIIIDAVGVMMEGAAALATGMVENAPNAVVDVGGRTTDLFWSEGVKPIARYCGAEAIGVERIADLVRQETLAAHRRDLSAAELRGHLRAYAAGAPPPRLFNRSKELLLNGVVEAAAQAVGDQLLSYIRRTWGDEQGQIANEAARVVLIGGGAYYFSGLLKAAIPHLEVPRSPELANAFGYLSVGLSATEDAWLRNRGV